MASKKPTQAPAFDAGAMIKSLTSAVKTFPAWKRWVEATAEYDGSGLRDVVNTNAVYLDAVKGDVDVHSQAILELQADVKALQEAPPARPFP